MQALLSPKALRLQVFWLIGRILSKINCKTQNVYDGNTYLQLPGFAWAVVYDQIWEPQIKYTDADEAIHTWVRDQDATIITFD